MVPFDLETLGCLGSALNELWANAALGIVA
jgi:hypothetical protein